MDGIEMVVRQTPDAADSAARFALGRALLLEAAATALGRPGDSIVITAPCPDCGQDHGRPTAAGVFLSLSRAPGVTIAIASTTGPVGVDVELRDGSEERLHAIQRLTGVASIRHWTTVEAVLKADGRGLRVDPSRVRVSGERAVIQDSTVAYRLYSPTVHESLVVTIARAISVSGQPGNRRPEQPRLE